MEENNTFFLVGGTLPHNFFCSYSNTLLKCVTLLPPPSDHPRYQVRTRPSAYAHAYTYTYAHVYPCTCLHMYASYYMILCCILFSDRLRPNAMSRVGVHDLRNVHYPNLIFHPCASIVHVHWHGTGIVYTH